MRVEIIGEDFRPLAIDARRVLVLADDGVTPLALASEYQPGMYCLAHCREGAAFNETLRRLGVDRRVRVDVARPRSLADFSLPVR